MPMDTQHPRHPAPRGHPLTLPTSLSLPVRTLHLTQTTSGFNNTHRWYISLRLSDSAVCLLRKEQLPESDQTHSSYLFNHASSA